MLRIFTIALIVAFLGSITPALAQGTTGSSGKAHMSGHNGKKVIKAKKGHKAGRKSKKGSSGTTVNPPK